MCVATRRERGRVKWNKVVKQSKTNQYECQHKYNTHFHTKRMQLVCLVETVCTRSWLTGCASYSLLVAKCRHGTKFLSLSYRHSTPWSIYLFIFLFRFFHLCRLTTMLSEQRLLRWVWLAVVVELRLGSSWLNDVLHKVRVEVPLYFTCNCVPIVPIKK